MNKVRFAWVFAFFSVLFPSCGQQQSPSVLTKRDQIVSYMLRMAELRWSPSEDIPYYEDTDGTKVFHAGENYVGLPYTMAGGRTLALGDPLNKFCLLLDEQGIYHGPATKDSYYGSDCSSSVEGAWRVNGLETNATYTGAMIPGENLKIAPVGGYDVSDKSNMTRSICDKNGIETMRDAYSLLQPGDALVRRIQYEGAYVGHVRLVESIDKKQQTVTVIEQCGYGIDSQTKTTWRVHRAYTFDRLFETAYIPICPVDLA